MNYDPNKIRINAIQVVKLTLGAWTFEKTFEVRVKSNCRGFDVLDAAIYSLVEDLPEIDGILYVDLDDTESPGSLRYEDDENKVVDWLRSLVIKAEILRIENEN